MAHIVCITTGLTGMLHASLEVCARLVAAGHRVTYACPQDVRDTIAAHGVDYHQLPAMALDPAPQLDPIPGRVHRKWAEVRTARARQRAGIEALGMATFREFVTEVEPSLLLLDLELHEHVLTAIAAGWPLALLSPWFAMNRRSGLPPLQSDIVPGSGVRGSRAGLRWAWLGQRLTHWWAIQKTRMRYVGTDRRGVLRAYAKSLGLPSRLLRQLDWETLFTYRGVTLLSMTAREMEFPHDPPPEMHYVGPMVHVRRTDTRADDSVRTELATTIAEARRRGQAVLYCSVSTMAQSPRSLLPRVIEAVSDRPEWLLIVGLGGARLPATPLPENVRAIDWVPQMFVLEHADCSINHGGIHTIHECITHAVPMIVYSGQQYDQNGCAARVAYHGLGIVADADADEPATIARRIDQLLGDEGIRDRVRAMRSRFSSYAEDRRLERLVESLLPAAPS